MTFPRFAFRTARPLPLLLACTLTGPLGCAPERHESALSTSAPAANPDNTAAINGAASDDSRAPLGLGGFDASAAPLGTRSDPETGVASHTDSDAAPGTPPASAEETSALGSDAGQTNASAPVDASALPVDDSVSQAYAALTRGDPHAISSGLEAVDRTLLARPDDGYAALYAGTLRLWKVSEATEGLGDVLSIPNLADEGLERLGRARRLMPNDFRVPGFLGLTQVNAGRLSADDALVQKGLTTLAQAIEQFPAYGHYLRAASTIGFPKDDPLFRGCVDDLVALAKECLFSGTDGEVAYVYPTGPTAAPSPQVCLNDGIVPHVWEGIFITFGDAALKAGWSTARVRALYRSAQTSPSYASWPFASMLEQRLARIDSDAQLYADDNPLNDPGLWVSDGHICTGCHQAR